MFTLQVRTGGTDNSSCLRGSSSTTYSDDAAEDCGIGDSVDVRHTEFSLCISKRERSWLVSVSGQEPRFSRDRGVTRSRSSLASQQFVKHALGRLDHTRICLAGDVAFLQTTGQYTGAFVEVAESLC